jgi:hypothetical protein
MAQAEAGGLPVEADPCSWRPPAHGKRDEPAGGEKAAKANPAPKRTAKGRER